MKTLRLDIKKETGEIYWTEYFNSESDLKKWVDAEKSRPYWVSREAWEFVVSDLTPPPPTAEEIAAQEAEKAEDEKVRKFLKGLKKSDLVDVPTCAEAIMKIIKHLRADR